MAAGVLSAPMHPIERLRYVARADGAGPSLLAQEAARGLAGFGADPAALVTACRLSSTWGPMPPWWAPPRDGTRPSGTR